MIAVYEESKFSDNMTVRIWDVNEKSYVSNSVFGNPAKGTITSEDYMHLKLSSSKYTLEVTDSNKIIISSKIEDSTPIMVPTTSMYTCEQNGNSISLLVVGGVVIAVVISAAIFYITKNPPIASEVGLTAAETVGGTVLKEAVGKVLNILGSYFVINLINDNGKATGFAASFTQAEKQYHFQPTDPLIIDLDGDGFETVAVSDGIYFDHDLDGFAETSSWVDDDDGVENLEKLVA